jgi:hypothetical protein
MTYNPNIYDLVRQEVQRQVGPEVSNQLRPSFFELLWKNHQFSYEIQNAVSRHLPNIVQNSLQNNSGIVSNIVQTQLPGILSQQHYFLDGLTQQRNTFQTMLSDQEQTYQTHQTTHLQQLDSASTNLIQDSIKNISNQNYILQQMEINVKTHAKQETDHQIQNFENNVKTELSDINSKLKWATFGSGLLGISLGGLLTAFMLH